MEYKDEEKNEFSYEKAIQLDQRSFCFYYISLLKTKHPLFFSFFYNNDYNSRIIKINLFITNFIINYAINSLFYTDETIHKIYEDEGKYNFIYQLPKIIYSSLIPIVLNIFLKKLALSNDSIISFKESNEKKDLIKRGNVLKNKIKIKIGFYFFINFTLLLIVWYYLSIFGAIYRNTQLYLLKDTLISLGFSLIYPFAIYLLPGICRIPSLSNNKKKRKCLYLFSKAVQIV